MWIVFLSFLSYFFLQQSIAKPFEALHILTANNISKLTIKLTVTYDDFVAIFTKLVLSRPRGSSDTFLLGKLVGHLAQSPVRYQNDDSNLKNVISRASFVQVPSYRSARRQMNRAFCSVGLKSFVKFCPYLRISNSLKLHPSLLLCCLKLISNQNACYITQIL